MAQTPRQPTAIYRPSWSSFFCRGVVSASMEWSIPAILPISVSIPVTVIYARPRPLVNVVPMYTMSGRLGPEGGF